MKSRILQCPYTYRDVQQVYFGVGVGILADCRSRLTDRKPRLSAGRVGGMVRTEKSEKCRKSRFFSPFLEVQKGVKNPLIKDRFFAENGKRRCSYPGMTLKIGKKRRFLAVFQGFGQNP